LYDTENPLILLYYPLGSHDIEIIQGTLKGEVPLYSWPPFWPV